MKISLAFVLLIAGCFPTPSAALVCAVDSDCADGRGCESGFCVTRNDAGVEQPDTDTSDASDVPDGPPAFDCKPFTTRLFAGCDIPEPGAAIDVSIGIATYNTDTGALSTGPSPPSQDLATGHVVSVEKITIAAGATLRVIGSKPLILASWSTITVDGTIDVGSTGTELGAGANPTECSTHAAAAGEADNTGAGGGGGGSMIAAGGRGGNGDGGNGGAGGAAVAAPLLLGGCAGGAGGAGRQAGGAGGGGGGAIQLAALESITISGKINAGGAGGRGAVGENGGGGGGGSGGMIGLESVQVIVTGVLAANGGGGGGGSTNDNNATGSPGQDGQLSATPATGGAPNNNGGGRGGVGGAGATTAGAQGQNDNSDAGGGGGGSCGFIVVASTDTASMGGTVSPVATTVAR